MHAPTERNPLTVRIALWGASAADVTDLAQKIHDAYGEKFGAASGDFLVRVSAGVFPVQWEPQVTPRRPPDASAYISAYVLGGRLHEALDLVALARSSLDRANGAFEALGRAIRVALDSDSKKAEHDALVAVAEALGA